MVLALHYCFLLHTPTIIEEKKKKDFCVSILQWGTADTEIKVPSVENSELTKVLPCKSWSRSEYSHACFTHCQEFLPCPKFCLHSPFTFLANCCFVLCVKHFDTETDWKCSSCILVWTHNFDEDLDFSNQFFGFWWLLYFIEHVRTNVFHIAIKWHEQGRGSICHCVNCVMSNQMAWTGPWQHLSLCELCLEQCAGGACGFSSPRFQGPTNCLSLWHSCQINNWTHWPLGRLYSGKHWPWLGADSVLWQRLHQQMQNERPQLTSSHHHRFWPSCSESCPLHC